MNVKKESIHKKDGSVAVVDLNNAKVQKKMFDYLQYGVAASDKRGHAIHLQTKVTPIQADILDGIKERGPKGYWKTQSQVLRSVISLGCYTALKILDKSDEISQFKEEFQLQELINRTNKRVRRNEILTEAVRAPVGALTLDNIDEEIKRLQKLLEDSE